MNEELKKHKNHVVITSDGWVYVLNNGAPFVLGDIDVDVEITDLRKNKKPHINPDLIRSMKESGDSVSDIAKELGISRPTVYKNLLKK